MNRGQQNFDGFSCVDSNCIYFSDNNNNNNNNNNNINNNNNNSNSNNKCIVNQEFSAL